MSLEELTQLEMQELGVEETLIRVLKVGKQNMDHLTEVLESKDRELTHTRLLMERSSKLVRDLEAEVKLLREENKQLRRLSRETD